MTNPNNDNLFKLHEVREPAGNVPPSRAQRDSILSAIRQYITDNSLVCPLSMDELKTHSDGVIAACGADQKYRDFIAVLINNETWRDTVASIPFNKRLLLLPKCLRNHTSCRGEFDHLGLVCDHCGGCMIDDLKTQAEKIGYAVLIAEGSPIVMSLIASGKVEAVVGVSCLSVLERTFPYMEAGAVPGIAIPLLKEGCVDTSVDADWLWEAIYLSSDEKSARLNLDQMRNEVDNWFTEDSLSKSLQINNTKTESLAITFLAAEGKRWRPFLAACAYEALADTALDIQTIPDGLKKAAVAVECFHKASLIHDDIEDEDDLRYGKKTLHATEGIAVALNVGDLLLGEGYRLLAQSDVDSNITSAMLSAAASGHRDLCIGQGNELTWAKEPSIMSEKQVIEIFRKKTSPAFAVALKVGALYAGAGKDVIDVLDEYSDALGVAYQIRDDIADFDNSLEDIELSLLLALAYHQSEGDDRKLLESAWNRTVDFKHAAKDIRNVIEKLKIRYKAFVLMESYKGRALGTLAALKSSRLKSLLRRVVYKIFNDTAIMGCCNDDKTRSD
jgi:geranylgeranyl diphosphate synthase type II